MTQEQKDICVKAVDMRSGFHAHVSTTTIPFHCELCGHYKKMVVFRARNVALGRTCQDLLDQSEVDLCGTNQKLPLKREYHRKYTNWDRCFEFTTDWEKQFVPCLAAWFNTTNINSNSTSAQLSAATKQLNIIDGKLTKLNQIKIEYLKDQFGITDINQSLLLCFTNRIKYYKNIIFYYGKLNKHVFFTDFYICDYGKCHGCGCKVYLKTQYEKCYVHHSGRQYMHQMEFIQQSDEHFVCAWCVGRAMQRASNIYNDLCNTSLLYNKRWCQMNYSSQIWFALGHLDNNRLPLFLSFYDIEYGGFRRGKIVRVNDDISQGILVKVALCDPLNQQEKEQWISLKSFHNCSFFIYNKPSTSWSHEFKSQTEEHPNKFWKEENTLIDTTREDNSFDPQNVFCIDGELIKQDWFVPTVHNGKSGAASFFRIKHMKKLYDVLEKKELLCFSNKDQSKAK